MKRKHTPGPWKCQVNVFGSQFRIYHEKNSGNIRHITHIDCSDPEGAENAVLIAAAPEMLELLEEVSTMVVLSSAYPDGPFIEQQLMDEVKAVIAKARGGA